MSFQVKQLANAPVVAKLIAHGSKYGQNIRLRGNTREERYQEF